MAPAQNELLFVRFMSGEAFTSLLSSHVTSDATGLVAEPLKERVSMKVAVTETFSAGSGTWCPDDDTRDSVIARRNVLTGLWAGRLLGLSNDGLSTYATEVHLADFQMDGEDDIVGKVAHDLSAQGLPYSEQQVRERLYACHREAFLQTAVTD
jgi:hypothetical protein